MGERRGGDAEGRSRETAAWEREEDGRAATVCGVGRRKTLACLRRLEACLLPPFGTAFTSAFPLGLSHLLSRLPS